MVPIMDASIGIPRDTGQVLHGAVDVRITVSFLVGGVQMEHTLVDAADLAVVIACLCCDCRRSHSRGREGARMVVHARQSKRQMGDEA